MKKCSKCGHDNQGTAKFCMECGAMLEHFCPQCCVTVPLEAKFCMACGANIADPKQTGPSGSGMTNNISEELYKQAVAIVLETRRASISLLQRQLAIGYTQAALLLESMEKRGVVSSMNGEGQREIFALSQETSNESFFSVNGRKVMDADNGDAGDNHQSVLVLVDLYQRIADQGVNEFDDLDGNGKASLVQEMAADFITQVSEQLENDSVVHLLGLNESIVTPLDIDSLDKVSPDNVLEFYDDGFIQFSVSNLTEADWAENLRSISGNLDCLITAIGEHPKFEGIIKQGYATGELEDGMISGDDEEEFLNNTVWVNQYNSYFKS